MKTLKFCIVALPTAVADAARDSMAQGQSDHALVAADSSSGYSCRHCLRFAQAGEHMILFPYAPLALGRPYSESGPIYVHAEKCERYTATSEFPAALRKSRVMRAYDSQENMVDAEVVNGNEPEAIIDALFRNPKVAFLQARSVSHGCFTMRIERA
ncbi:MAG: DUF1203 domain-containing protein [Chthoniobacterales bacterium]